MVSFVPIGHLIRLFNIMYFRVNKLKLEYDSSLVFCLTFSKPVLRLKYLCEEVEEVNQHR